MATRSAIGYKLPNGAIRAVYCHWDGYVESNGRILVEHYQSAIDIARLVELGDMSSLGKDTDSTEYYDRERVVGGLGAIEYANDADYVSNFEMAGIEYWYYWSGTKWLVSKGNGLFTSIETALALQDI